MVQICLVLRTPLALLVQETGGFQGYLWLLTFSDSRLQKLSVASVRVIPRVPVFVRNKS